MSRIPDPTAKISLLRAAEAVFAEHGVAGAKVEDITRRAGLSKGAFYLHFKSKEEALKQVAESFLARCGGHFRDPPGSSGPGGSLELTDVDPDDPVELLARWHELDLGAFEFLWQNRATLAILSGCQGTSDLQYLMLAFHEEMHQMSQRWGRFFKERGLYRARVDEELAATLVCGAYNELVRRMLASPKRPPFERWLLETEDVFVRGLGTPRLVEALEVWRGDGVDADPERKRSKRKRRSVSGAAETGE